MIQKLRAYAALTKDPGSAPSNYMAAHNYVTPVPFWPPQGPAHIYIYTGKKTFTHKIFKKLSSEQQESHLCEDISLPYKILATKYIYISFFETRFYWGPSWP